MLILDGAMGTSLKAKDPLSLNFTDPDRVLNVHKAYAEAGAQVLLTNTFGLSREKLKKLGQEASVQNPIDALVSRATALAKAVASKTGARVALSIGPTGELPKPLGTISFDEMYSIFSSTVQAGVKAGADIIFIETMASLLEVKCALLASKENSNLPVFACMTFEENGRTYLGTDLKCMALTLEGLGANCIGLNCSTGPKGLLKAVKELRTLTSLPIIVKPNAGLPSVKDGETAYNLGANEFALQMQELVDAGAEIIGGCCGTTPEYIKRIKALKPTEKVLKPERTLSSACSGTKAVFFDSFKIIGERLNPSNNTELQNALKDKDYGIIEDYALMQLDDGADMLDLNVCLGDSSERETLADSLMSVQAVCNLPVCIDTMNTDALEHALRLYDGIPIINSITGADKSLNAVLPLAKKYGAMLVCLTMDEKGIPFRALERVRIAKKIIARAKEYGIHKNRLLIDCLCLPKAFYPRAKQTTLSALKRLKTDLDVLTILGISNYSFGLREREKHNSAFLAECRQMGLDCAIMNPAHLN